MSDTSMLETERTRAEIAANAERRRREPIAGPLEIVAFILAVSLIWGPLAAGAFRS